MSLEQLTELFKWMTIINIGLLIFSSLLIMALRNTICKMHCKFFGIEENQRAVVTYGYLGLYKALIIVFNLVPYLALSLIQ